MDNLDKLLEEFHPKKIIEKRTAFEYSDSQIDEVTRQVLALRGIEKLYRHQANAIALIEKGENIVISAPTASGKSEIFIIPAVKAALLGKCTLILYPTKALARDQEERIKRFSLLGARCGAYDGDTPQAQRDRIVFDRTPIIVTNVDMLHHMLMHSRRFAYFFENLKYVVIDEVHCYTGTFGAHVHNVMKRLKRVVNRMKHGRLKISNEDVKTSAAADARKDMKTESQLRFICCSATIGNAGEFAEALLGETFQAMSTTGRASDMCHYLIYSQEVGVFSTTAAVAEKLPGKFLVFANSHRTAELLNIYARRLGLRTAIYRSGFDDKYRRNVEKEFKDSGDRGLKGLVTTSALELGMDIGDVGSVILCGYPGRLTRVRQRLGRAGRRGQTGYGIYIARENPLDLFYFENTDEYVGGHAEKCYLNPTNEEIATAHLLAMMKDYPLTIDELNDEPQAQTLLEKLVGQKLALNFRKVYIPTSRGNELLRGLGLRSVGRRVDIFEGDRQIGFREMPMAINELFEGALYLHAGETYRVESLDLKGGIARVARMLEETEYYTKALHTKDADPLKSLVARKSGNGANALELNYGKVHMCDSVNGFAIKEIGSNLKVGEKHFDSGEELTHEYDTNALWFDVPEGCGGELGTEDFSQGLHALEHIMIALLPTLTTCDPNEIGGISYPSGRVFIYEGVHGGNGIVRAAFGGFGQLLERAGERLGKCPCKEGCPACILDANCGNDNHYLNKHTGLKIAEFLLGD
ncbi:hypothetical protein AUJ13_03640 [Candidatus Micrarchaeota archaeon CG1_02_49_24]|nr:MAG: hypothetical protein AUJ13_03640 [Candidatus Micrarchaeota archaeon CG1_02_49_24]